MMNVAASSPEDEGVALEEALAFFADCDFSVISPASSLDGENALQLQAEQEDQHQLLNAACCDPWTDEMPTLTPVVDSAEALEQQVTVSDGNEQAARFTSTSAASLGSDSSAKSFPSRDSMRKQTRKKVPVQLRTASRRRRRPKDDLVLLRTHVYHLTARRDQLKLEARRKAAADRQCERASGRSSPYQSASLWEQVAALQLSQRKRAEADNGELRTLLQTQRRKAQYLKRALLKDADTEARIMDQLLGVNQRNLPSDSTPANNDAVFEELASNLGEMYLEVEEMFDSSAAQAFSPSLTPSRWRTPDADSGVVFTDQERMVVPFHRLVADRAVWESMGERGVRDSKNHFIKSFDVTDNTKSSSWRASYKRDRLKIDVLLRKVARKFVSENRTVVVCRMLMEPTSLATMSLAGLKYYETRYLVIEPGPSSDVGPKSTIHCYLKVERQSERNGSDERDQANRLGFMSEYEVVTWRGLMKARNQILENLLLEEESKVMNSLAEWPANSVD